MQAYCMLSEDAHSKHSHFCDTCSRHRHKLVIMPLHTLNWSFWTLCATVHNGIYKGYHSVPSLELGLSHPLSRQRVWLCPSPRNQRVGGAHSPAGEGLGDSQFQRLEKKLAHSVYFVFSTLSTRIKYLARLPLNWICFCWKPGNILLYSTVLYYFFPWLPFSEHAGGIRQYYIFAYNLHTIFYSKRIFFNRGSNLNIILIFLDENDINLVVTPPLPPKSSTPFTPCTKLMFR